MCMVSYILLSNKSCHQKYTGHKYIRLQLEEVLLPGRVVGGTEACDGVPALDGAEADVAAGAVATVGEDATKVLVTLSDIVVEAVNLSGGVERRVGEADRALASRHADIINAVQDGSNDGSRHGSTAAKAEISSPVDETVVTGGGNVRVGSAGTVVDAAAGGGDGAIGSLVGEVVGVMAEEVVGDGILLPGGAGEDVAEATARGEAVGDNLGVANLAALGQVSGANSGDVRAVREEVGGEDVVVGASAGVSAAGDTSVTARDDDGDTDHAELHELVADTLDSLDGLVHLGITVRDGDDAGGQEAAAHHVRVTVGVALASLLINSTDEVGEDLAERVTEVVVLEQGGVLGLDDGVGDLEVEDRLAATILLADRSSGTVDQIKLGSCALGHVGGNMLPVPVEILLVKSVTGFPDTKVVGVLGGVLQGNLVQLANALRCEDLVAANSTYGPSMLANVAVVWSFLIV